mmetsp:Transcript_18533/g.42773  ORF Transcript_18533/g.42773 Transcript_18533/m.42773 type:complete len:239 (-) Transcript_18533:88-804(-)
MPSNNSLFWQLSTTPWRHSADACVVARIPLQSATRARAFSRARFKAGRTTRRCGLRVSIVMSPATKSITISHCGFCAFTSPPSKCCTANCPHVKGCFASSEAPACGCMGPCSRTSAMGRCARAAALRRNASTCAKRSGGMTFQTTLHCSRHPRKRGSAASSVPRSSTADSDAVASMSASTCVDPSPRMISMCTPPSCASIAVSITSLTSPMERNSSRRATAAAVRPQLAEAGACGLGR